MKVGFLQTNPIFGNKKDNFKNIKDKIGNKKVEGEICKLPIV